MNPYSTPNSEIQDIALATVDLDRTEQQKSLYRKFVYVWFGTILILHVLFCIGQSIDINPVSPMLRIAVTTLFTIVWLPISFLLVYLLITLSGRLSSKFWVAVCTLPIVIIVAFLVSVVGFGISNYFGIPKSVHIMSLAWSQAIVLTIISSPVYFVGCIWLNIRLRKLKSSDNA